MSVEENRIKKIEEATAVLTIPQNLPLSNIFVPNFLVNTNAGIISATRPKGFNKLPKHQQETLKLMSKDVYAVMHVAPQDRSFTNLTALNSLYLAEPFKGKEFNILLQDTVLTTDYYIKSLGVNKGAGSMRHSVPPTVVGPLMGDFEKYKYDGTWSDFWGDTVRPITITFIVKDVNGEFLDVPLQATPENRALYQKRIEEYAEWLKPQNVKEREKEREKERKLNNKKTMIIFVMVLAAFLFFKKGRKFTTI